MWVLVVSVIFAVSVSVMQNTIARTMPTAAPNVYAILRDHCTLKTETILIMRSQIENPCRIETGSRVSRDADCAVSSVYAYAYTGSHPIARMRQ